MQEAVRRHYLAALGIDRYLPRRPLPGAAVVAETVAATVAETVAVTVDAEAAMVDVAGGNELDLVSPPRQDVAIETAAKIPPRVQPVLDGEKTLPARTETLEGPAAEPVRFSLSVWRIEPDLLIVDSRQLELALPTDQLLRNFLRAVGYGSAVIPRAEVLRWPPAKRSAAVDDTHEAAAMVEAFLSAQQAKRPYRWLLLMGDSAGRFALPDVVNNLVTADASTPISGGPWPFAEHCQAFLVPSLSAMLQRPELKAVTWRLVQPLRQR